MRTVKAFTLFRGGGSWVSTKASLKAFLAGNSSANNPHSLAVMPSPPTITTSTANLDPTYPNILYLDTASYLDQTLVEQGRKYITSSFLFTYPATQDNTGAYLSGTTEKISVTANADVVCYYVVGSTLRYRFLVDEFDGNGSRYVDLTGTLAATTSGLGQSFIVLTFASKAVRKVTIELQQTQALRTIQIKSGDSYGTRPAAKQFRAVALGDSVAGATGATALGDGLVNIAGDYLGISDFWASGVGGTGYVNDVSATKFKLYDRLTNALARDLDAAVALGTVDIVVVAMGLNDIGLSGVQAEASRCFDYIRALCPSALVFVVGTWDASAPSAPGGAYTTLKTAIQAAVGTRGGFWFLDPQGVSYTKFDAVHPDTAGHRTLGRWLEGQIRAKVAA